TQAKHHPDDNPRDENRLRGEAHPLESRRGKNQGRSAASGGQGRAADEELGAPAPANVVNDRQELLVHKKFPASGFGLSAFALCATADKRTSDLGSRTSTSNLLPPAS